MATSSLCTTLPPIGRAPSWSPKEAKKVGRASCWLLTSTSSEYPNHLLAGLRLGPQRMTAVLPAARGWGPRSASAVGKVLRSLLPPGCRTGEKHERNTRRRGVAQRRLPTQGTVCVWRVVLHGVFPHTPLSLSHCGTTACVRAHLSTQFVFLFGLSQLKGTLRISIRRGIGVWVG